MLAPFWILLIVDEQQIISNKFKRFFFLILFAFTLLIFSIRVFQVTIGPEHGFYGRLNTPIIESLKKIPKDLINSSKFVKSYDFNIGTHLLTFFKDKNIIIGKRKFFKHKSSKKEGCLYIWDENSSEPNLKFSKSNQIKTRVGKFEYKMYYGFLEGNNC